MSNWLKSKESHGFQDIQRAFSLMMEDGRHIFDAAANALVGGTDPEAIREDLFATDRRINQTEQRIRRMIVVHGTVRGANSFPSLLVMMSLAKDAERIGDYAKNIFDLAANSVDLGPPDQRAKLVAIKDEISRVLGEARDVQEAQDEAAARRLLHECDRLEDLCDGYIGLALEKEGKGSVGFALASRYFKRVTAHAGNVVTSVVMPLDKLDFFDED